MESVETIFVDENLFSRAIRDNFSCILSKFYRLIMRIRFVDEWQSVEKRNGDEISSTLENSSVAVLQADKSVLKIKGTVLSRHLKLFEGNFGSTEMKSDPIFPFASSFYIPDRTFLVRMERKTFS